MRAQILILLWLSLTSYALAEEIKGQVVNKEGEPLQKVKWCKLNGELVSGETDKNGEFSINLPSGKERLTVNFIKPSFERVFWVLDCQSDQSECREPKLHTIKLENPFDKISDGKKNPPHLHLKLSPDFGQHAPQNAKTIMLESFQDMIADHLQALPEILPDIRIEVIENDQNSADTLAKIEVKIKPSPDDPTKFRIHFIYQTIPSPRDFPPIREWTSYTVVSEKLESYQFYESISERWGFYTLLALCMRAAFEFDPGKPKTRTELVRVRQYLIGELKQLGRGEQLKYTYVRELLGIIDGQLGLRSMRLSTQPRVSRFCDPDDRS